MLTHEKLLHVLHYNPETGVFTWLKGHDQGRRGPRMAGKRAGGLHGEGYRYIEFERVKHRAARLAFFYMTKEWPQKIMDHINRNRDDDRWCNLREVTSSENRMNYVREGHVLPPDLSHLYPAAFAQQ